MCMSIISQAILKTKLVRKQIYLSESVYINLKKEAVKSQKSTAELIRNILEDNQKTKEALKAIKSHRPLKTFKLKDQGTTNFALTHNDIYE
jgi:hypothetical protein